MLPCQDGLFKSGELGEPMSFEISKAHSQGRSGQKVIRLDLELLSMLNKFPPIEIRDYRGQSSLLSGTASVREIVQIRKISEEEIVRTYYQVEAIDALA